MAGGGFTDSIEAVNVCLPPAVDIKTAVIVLGTERNLQQFMFDVDALVIIEINCRLVHDFQPFDRRLYQSPALFNVFISFFAQICKLKVSAERIFGEVQKHSPALALFKINESVDDG